MPAKKGGQARLSGAEKLARQLQKGRTLSGSVTGVDQTPRVFRLAQVISLDPLTVVFNDDPTNSTVVGLPALKTFAGAAGVAGADGAPVAVDPPITGDGSIGDPLDLAFNPAGLRVSGIDELELVFAADGGLTTVANELSILLDPATDPAAASLSAAGLLITGAGGGGGGGGGPTSAVTQQDNFNRANESPVGAGAIGDPPAHSGSYRVVSNELASNGSVGENLCWWTSPTPDFDFEITFTTLPTDGGLVFGLDRYGDNYMLLNYAPTDGSTWKLYARRGGFTSVLSPGTAGANGDVLKVQVRNGQFEIFLNGVSYIDSVASDIALYARAPFGNGGVRLNSDTTARCDNMTMTSYFQCCGGSSGGAYDIDDPVAYEDAYGPDLGWDQEFNATAPATSLPTGWVYQNSHSATYLEQLGNGKTLIASGSNTISDITCLVQPLSGAPSTWVAEGHVRNYPFVGVSRGMCIGLVLTDGTKAVGILWNSNPLLLVSLWDNIASTYNSNPATLTVPEGQANVNYWRIRKNGTTSYDFEWSWDGYRFNSLLAAYDVSAFMTPTHIGFLMRMTSGAQEFDADWFRLR